MDGTIMLKKKWLYNEPKVHFVQTNERQTHQAECWGYSQGGKMRDMRFAVSMGSNWPELIHPKLSDEKKTME